MNCPTEWLSKSFLAFPSRPVTGPLALVSVVAFTFRHLRVPSLPLIFCPQPTATPGSPVVLVLPQSYFLSRAQSLCGPERSAVPDSLRWLCHPLGQKFFMERSWSVKSAAKESLYCAQRNPGESAFGASVNGESHEYHQDSRVTAP